MGYRIDFDNPLGEEVRSIASELLTGAIDFLERQPDGPNTAIHDARKNIKRVRALYRLIASDAADFTIAENIRLRDLARSLSHLRDHAALAETTEYLEKQTDHKHARPAIARLGLAMKNRRDNATSRPEAIQETLVTCCAGLHQAADALDDLNLPRLRKQAIQCVADGWRKVGKKAHKALSACHGSDEEEPFHELRKRAQDRFMHAALLRSIWPSGMVSIQRQAKELVEILGHEHDLAMLHEQALDRMDTDPEEQQTLQQAIAAERAKLQAQARELAQDIFDGKPKRDAEIVAFLIKNRR